MLPLANQAEAPRPPHRVRATEGSVPASLPAREEGTRGPQTPAHLEGAGAQLQPVLQELVHRGLDADALLLGQRSHREGADHHLLPHWNRPGAESEEREHREQRMGRESQDQDSGCNCLVFRFCSCVKASQVAHFSISPSNEYSVLISFRIDWLDLLAVQGTLKSLLQHHSSKASILCNRLSGQWSSS